MKAIVLFILGGMALATTPPVSQHLWERDTSFKTLTYSWVIDSDGGLLGVDIEESRVAKSTECRQVPKAHWRLVKLTRLLFIGSREVSLVCRTP